MDRPVRRLRSDSIQGEIDARGVVLGLPIPDRLSRTERRLFKQLAETRARHDWNPGADGPMIEALVMAILESRALSMALKRLPIGNKRRSPVEARQEAVAATMARLYRMLHLGGTDPTHGALARRNATGIRMIREAAAAPAADDDGLLG